MTSEFINNLDLEAEKNSDLQGKILTFKLGEQRYGIEIEYTIEIIGMQQITAVPRTPIYIKGILNSRGKIIPVIDVGMRFGYEPKPYDDRTCIIVIEVEDLTIGLVVEAIEEVITITDENVSDMPTFSNVNNTKFVKFLAKVGEQINIILDCKQMFCQDELMLF